jgi:hypothetical protein
MNAIKATWRNGQMIPLEPVDWPDGTEARIEPLGNPMHGLGMDESVWRDDPESLADWAAWLKTIEPLEFTAEEIAERLAFEEKLRQFNLAAVRAQMEQGPKP